MTHLKKKNIFFTVILYIFLSLVTVGIAQISYGVLEESVINLLKIVISIEFIFTGLFYVVIKIIFKNNENIWYYFGIQFILFFMVFSIVNFKDIGVYLSGISLILLKILYLFLVYKRLNIPLKIKPAFIINSIVLFGVFLFLILEIKLGMNICLIITILYDSYIFYQFFKNKYKNNFIEAFIYCQCVFLLIEYFTFSNLFDNLNNLIFSLLVGLVNLVYLSFFIVNLKNEQKEFYKNKKLMNDLIIMSNKLYMTNREKENLKTSILLNQIKPHFLYNILNTISALCSIDPEKAEQMTVSFGKYLRSNMSNLNQQEIVSFEDEIEHVKNYVNLELIRFNAVEDKIKVIYDLKETNFYLPPLTIQPLVENAIKHGIREKDGEGILKISSYIEDNFYCISIQDNGIGFEPEKHLSENSIGLENIRKRLHNVVKGSLEIQSKIGQGTKTTIKIIKDRLY